MFKPRNGLDWVFAVGLVDKGLNAVVELIGGLRLLFLSPPVFATLRWR